MLEIMRRSVARDLELEYGLEYNEALCWMQDNDVFGSWSAEELQSRPVDLAELAGCIEDGRCRA